MRLIKNRLYKQRISSFSKFPISYSRGKFGRQRRNFPLASAMRENSDFERPQRTKESEVSREYNTCNNVKLPHEFSAQHSCHSLTHYLLSGCLLSIINCQGLYIHLQLFQVWYTQMLPAFQKFFCSGRLLRRIRVRTSKEQTLRKPT